MPRRITQLRVGAWLNAFAYLFRVVLVPARTLVAERAHGAVHTLPHLGIRTQGGAAILAGEGGSGHTDSGRIISVGRGRRIVSPTAPLGGEEGAMQRAPRGCEPAELGRRWRRQGDWCSARGDTFGDEDQRSKDGRKGCDCGWLRG